MQASRAITTPFRTWKVRLDVPGEKIPSMTASRGPSPFISADAPAPEGTGFEISAMVPSGGWWR